MILHNICLILWHYLKQHIIYFGTFMVSLARSWLRLVHITEDFFVTVIIRWFGKQHLFQPQNKVIKYHMAKTSLLWLSGK